MKMSEEELCERICQLEKELKEEKEKHKDLSKRYNLLQLCYENDISNSISKDKIREKIKEYKNLIDARESIRQCGKEVIDEFGILKPDNLKQEHKAKIGIIVLNELLEGKNE